MRDICEGISISVVEIFRSKKKEEAAAPHLLLILIFQLSGLYWGREKSCHFGMINRFKEGGRGVIVEVASSSPLISNKVYLVYGRGNQNPTCLMVCSWLTKN